MNNLLLKIFCIICFAFSNSLLFSSGLNDLEQPYKPIYEKNILFPDEKFAIVDCPIKVLIDKKEKTENLIMNETTYTGGILSGSLSILIITFKNKDVLRTNSFHKLFNANLSYIITNIQQDSEISNEEYFLFDGSSAYTCEVQMESNPCFLFNLIKNERIYIFLYHHSNEAPLDTEINEKLKKFYNSLKFFE